MTNSYLGRDIQPVDKLVTFTLDSGAYAIRKDGLRLVAVRALATASDDPNCPTGTIVTFGVAGRKGSSAELRIDMVKGRCLSSRTISWTTRRFFKSVKISLPKQVQ
jgi:hypothetical protein